MNASNATSRVPVPLEDILTKYGKTLFMNYLWLYPFVISGSVGFVFNIVSFVIFQGREFNTPLYAYLRVYSINSAQVCFFSVFIFLANTIHFFEWTNQYWTNAYYLYVYIPFVNFGYFFGTFLDIVITLDRISNFNRYVRALMKLSAHKSCMLGFILCLVIDFPYFFVFVPNSATFDVINKDGQIIRDYVLWFADLSTFAKSKAGTIILFMIYAFRDLFLMLLEIAVNIVSIWYLKAYLNKKAGLVAKTNSVTVSLAAITNKNKPMADGSLIRSAQDVGSTSENIRHLSNSVLNITEQRATIMVILMSVLSIAEHLLILACIIYPIVEPNGGFTIFLLYLIGKFLHLD
jgi:hypothetical protein